MVATRGPRTAPGVRPRRAAAAVSVVAGLALAAPQVPEPLAWVELAPWARAYYVGELVPLEVRLAVDERLTRPDWPQLFAQPLDLPVQLEAAWLDAPAFGRLLPEGEARAPSSRSFALAHGVAHARWLDVEPRDRLRRHELAYVRWVAAERTGRFVLEAPRLRYAEVVSRERDVFDSAVAVDTRFVTVAGEPVELEVLALPDAGRPASFTGAIGEFDLGVEAAPRELEVGGELVLTLTVSGSGNLAAIAPPRLADSRDWHLLGVLDETSAGARTFRYSLRAASEAARATPSVEFAYFAPASASYRTLASPALPVSVAARAREPGPGTAGEPKTRAPRWPWAGGALVALVLLALGRRRRRARGALRAARPALVRLEQELARPVVDLEASWTAFLAEELGVAPAAVSSHDLAARLARAGAASDTAERAARALGEQVGARFGGGAPTLARAELLRLAAALDAELARPREPGARA